MTLRCLLVLTMPANTPAHAADADPLMREYAWERRVLLIFAPHEQHAAYRRQVALLDPVGAGLGERDMTVIEAFAGGPVVIDGRRQAIVAASLHRRFAVSDEAFGVILVGKDGTVKLDRGDVVTSAELFTLIDAMPMRRREMREPDEPENTGG